MLQPPRSSNSRSFLREAKDSLVLIENDKEREYFLRQINDLINKRESLAKFTGAKALRKELLAFLKQRGEVRTANIWARDLLLERDAINELKKALSDKLLENNIQGILEIHLSDREINSPHIQFVGNNANEAERLIADELLKRGYESSLESALSKKEKEPFIPYFEINPKATIEKLEEGIEATKKQKLQDLTQIPQESIKPTTSFSDTLKNSIQNFISSLKNQFEKFKTQREKKREEQFSKLSLKTRLRLRKKKKKD